MLQVGEVARMQVCVIVMVALLAAGGFGHKMV